MEQQEIQSIKQRFNIIGQSAQLSRGIEIAVQVAKTDLSVLVTGESGVGKEHFPKIIHQYSARKHGPYFAVNCGAIPEGTIESELFGHEKGAFTDARSERRGYFEIADGGTLFLDEVGELPIAMQAKLLRVLETGEYLRMGSSEVRKTDVRVVAATNLDMRRAINEGRFREDLYYRLNTIEIHVPALRERKDDIPLLFRKFSLEFSDHYHMPAIRLTEDAISLLKHAYWRGNIRQLKNIAETVTLMEHEHAEVTADRLAPYLPANEQETGLVVTGSHQSDSAFANDRDIYQLILTKMQREMNTMRHQLDELMAQRIPDNGTPSPTVITQHTNEPAVDDEVQEGEDVTDTPATSNTTPPLSLRDREREAIRQALERNKGNRKVTAAELGMPERTLYRRINEYGL